MLFFSPFQKTLFKAALFQEGPLYVQFYITARCNLTCQQCNVIYANSDMRECSLEEIKRIADNFAKMGVVIVLLTGGEPFVREDLPEIIREFESRGIHVRMQTNGLAHEEEIHKVVEYGGKDISISLDTLRPDLQDKINGEFQKSWHSALKAMALFTKYLPKKESFASLGCVMQPGNLADVPEVIQFGTRINWYTSLVPIHVTDNFHPMSFRTFDKKLAFRPEHYLQVDQLVEKIRRMRQEGYLLYDSDQYLDDIKRFVKKEPITWRDRNEGLCDSPNLYFAVMPNGSFAPCCDYRFSESLSTYAPDFPEVYRNALFRKKVAKITSQCSGCMYGSYPEMTIAMRFLAAKIQRMQIFFASPPEKKWPIPYEEMLEITEKIRNGNKIGWAPEDA